MSVLLGCQLPNLSADVSDEGKLIDPGTITLVITKPDLTTTVVTPTHDSTGKYSAVYVPVVVGPFVALWTTTVPAITMAQRWTVETFTAGPILALAALKTYLGTTTFSDGELSATLATETAAQLARCRMPAIVPAELVEALKRRVQCNLARRALPLGLTGASGDGDSPAYLPGNDPEVRRLEAPWRRMVVG
jgi:hypothetical protein